ncbi:unnamed protein product, partial [Ectocarpus sp. 12 AP-2014]
MLENSMIEKKAMHWKNITISNLILLVFMLGCSPKAKKQAEQTEQDKLEYEPVIMAYYVAEPNYEPEKIPVEKL